MFNLIRNNGKNGEKITNISLTNRRKEVIRGRLFIFETYLKEYNTGKSVVIEEKWSADGGSPFYSSKELIAV